MNKRSATNFSFQIICFRKTFTNLISFTGEFVCNWFKSVPCVQSLWLIRKVAHNNSISFSWNMAHFVWTMHFHVVANYTPCFRTKICTQHATQMMIISTLRIIRHLFDDILSSKMCFVSFFAVVERILIILRREIITTNENNHGIYIAS